MALSLRTNFDLEIIVSSKLLTPSYITVFLWDPGDHKELMRLLGIPNT